MKRIIILTMLLFPFILVCSQGKYHINGILNNDYNGKYVKLFQFQGDTLITSIDSAKVQKGKFSFKGKANVDEFAIVTIGKYPYIKSVEVVLEEGDIRVYMDTAFVASGTPLNDLRNSLNSEVTRLCGVWYDLMIKSDTIDVERDKAHDDYQKFIYNATIENRLNLVGRRFIADNKSAIWPLENLVKLHEQLEALQKNNSLVTQADNRLHLRRNKKKLLILSILISYYKIHLEYKDLYPNMLENHVCFLLIFGHLGAVLVGQIYLILKRSMKSIRIRD